MKTKSKQPLTAKKKKPALKPYPVLEVISGVEGPSVSIGVGNLGTRVLGPKPWGGGTITHTWILTEDRIDHLIAELEAVKVDAEKAAEDRFSK